VFAASRVHHSAQRTMHVLSDRGSCQLDFQAKTAQYLEHGAELRARRLNPECMSPGEREVGKSRLNTELLIPRPLTVTDNNAILEELREFGAAIRGETQVRVDGLAGAQAVALAERILAELAATRSHHPLVPMALSPLRKAG